MTDSQKQPFKRAEVPTEFRQVPFTSIVIEPETWAFRDKSELDANNPSIKHLAESIRLEGFLTRPAAATKELSTVGYDRCES